MSKETYRIISRGPHYTHEEIPFTVVTGHPYFADQCAALALFNRVDSGKIVRLRGLQTNPQNTQGAIGNAPLFTAGYGATLTPFGTEHEEVTIFKLDSNNAAVPSQVKAYGAYDGSINFSVVRRPFLRDLWSKTTALAHLASRNLYGSLMCLSAMDPTTAERQRYTIREGQYFTMLANNQTDIDERQVIFSCIFRIGSETYAAYSDKFTKGKGTQGANQNGLTISNETGSGVVIEIVEISMQEAGDSSLLPFYTMEPIDYMDPTAYEAADLVSNDSTNGSLTGLIDVGKNARVHLRGYNNGSLIERNYIKRMVLPPPRKYTQAVVLGLQASRAFHELNWIPGVTDFIINPGEGMALFKRLAHPGDLNEFVLGFTVEDESVVVAGGEYGFAH